MQKISISFISNKLRKELSSLKEGDYREQKLYGFINRAFHDIEIDISCSIKIPKRLWPKSYKKFGIDNLWKYDLPNGWRLMFTLEKDEICIIALVLEWLSHKDYEKRFNY